jgi:hypothetical protein
MVILYIKYKTAMLINIAIFDRQFRFFTAADSIPAYSVNNKAVNFIYLSFTPATPVTCVVLTQTPRAKILQMYSRLQAKNPKFRIYLTVAHFPLN